METIFKKGVYKILKVFYTNHNSPVYLRELARLTKLNPNSITRFLDKMVADGILISKKEGHLRKSFLSDKYIPIIFPIFDSERAISLSFSRRKSIYDYFNKINKKPFCILLFGSTASGNDKDGSDIDLLEITDSKEDNSQLLKDIESERGIKLQVIRITIKKFKQAIVEKDAVILSAINTGFPVFGKDFFYEVIKNE